jgi:hypothetical protein
MHYPSLKGPIIVALLGAGLLLSGCATRESVERAQATADSAKADAAAAMSAAQHAQSSADSAGTAAHSAAADAQRANDRLDHLPPPEEHHMRWHRHGHHGHHARHHHSHRHMKDATKPK